MLPTHPSSFIRRTLLPWLFLALAVVPAVWHVLDFDEDVDPEFPAIFRPAFSRVPPAAYRLAEPGDTLDRIMIYMSAASVVLAAGGLLVHRGKGLWPAALALGAAGLWYSATPGPTVDGWHGLGWRSIFDLNAPPQLRIVLLLAAVALLCAVTATLLHRRRQLHEFAIHSQEKGTIGLWVAAVVLVIARQFDIPGVEPQGYWPRWAMIWGLLAFDLALLIELAPRFRPSLRALLIVPLVLASWLALVVTAVALSWYHRPLARLKTVEPGRIYISAMPTIRGLEVAHARHRFRTIINLFPEDTPLGSPLLPDELRFAREHGIRYVGSPSDPSEEASSSFLDRTLALAQDPSAWPILVHCHGCMDRSPAWMGIYKFVVREQPLCDIMKEIERHRGYRPKASVILLYNRVLPPRAGMRYWRDPTAALLRECARGTQDPMNAQPRSRPGSIAIGDPPRLTSKAGSVTRKHVAD
jgi:hypothetical protein